MSVYKEKRANLKKKNVDVKPVYEEQRISNTQRLAIYWTTLKQSVMLWIKKQNLIAEEIML